jgi:hypothetical protein
MKYLLALLFLSLLSCKHREKKEPSKYFEGKVELKIDIETSLPEVREKVIKAVGEYAVTYIKDSFVCRAYYGSNGVINAREIFRPDSLKLYRIRENSDTISTVSFENDYFLSNLSMKEVQGKQILGKKCLGVLMVNQSRASLFSDPEIVNSIYYFDTSTRLSPEMHRSVRYGSFDKIFSRYPFLTLGYESDYKDLKISMTATRIIPGKVSDIFFDIPKNKVIVDGTFE